MWDVACKLKIKWLFLKCVDRIILKVVILNDNGMWKKVLDFVLWLFKQTLKANFSLTTCKANEEESWLGNVNAKFQTSTAFYLFLYNCRFCCLTRILPCVVVYCHASQKKRNSPVAELYPWLRNITKYTTLFFLLRLSNSIQYDPFLFM